MTAHHVVSDGSAITVAFAVGTETSATVTGADESIDIATLAPADLPEVVVPAVLDGGVTVGSPWPRWAIRSAWPRPPRPASSRAWIAPTGPIGGR